MSNGSNEPVEFTRGDAECLRLIEFKQKELITKIDRFLTSHSNKHEVLEKQINKNSRFRRITLKILLWVLTTGSGTTLLAAGAKAMGWLN